MYQEDGNRLIHDTHGYHLVKCSRFAELRESMHFHVGLAHAGFIPSEFRLLNATHPFRIGFDVNQSEQSHQAMQSLFALFDQEPNGGTPLCRHIYEIAAEIRNLAPVLQAQAQKALVMIATDGESSDGNVADALRQLEHLPCQVVIRLCTNEERIVR
jgi:hypothetical protein